MLHTLTLPETLTFFHGELGLGKSEQDVADMMEDYLMRYYAERSVMRPGALEFVRELRARGIRCSIASSTPHAMLVAGCEHTGLAPLVSAIVSTDDVGASKREPAVYDRARELMGTPVAATWVFETRPTRAHPGLHRLSNGGHLGPGRGRYLRGAFRPGRRGHPLLCRTRRRAFCRGRVCPQGRARIDGPGRQAPAGRPVWRTLLLAGRTADRRGPPWRCLCLTGCVGYPGYQRGATASIGRSGDRVRGSMHGSCVF